MRIQICQCQNAVVPIDMSLSILERALYDAQMLGVDLVIFPELFLGGYPVLEEQKKYYTDNNQEALVYKVTNIARNYGVGVMFGMMRSYLGEQFNSALLVSLSGEIIAEYHKNNLFGVFEKNYFTPGETPSKIINFLGRRVALGICYDVENESFVKDLSIRGAEFIFAIAANMQPFDDVSNIILPRLSERYSIRIVYVNYVGYDSIYTYCGRSCVTDAKGGHIFLGSPSKAANYIVEL